MAEPFIGEIRLFSFGIIPKGWAPCNGQIMQVNTNQALFTVLGNRFGGDGKDTFALPDLRGRTPVDVSPEYPIGTAGGEAAHALTVNEIPQHTHQAVGDSGAATLPSPSGNVWGTTAASRPIYASTSNVKLNPEAIGTAGGSQAHNNMQPYTAVSFCIALQGIYPPKY
ncbi:phage tail protein [Paenibacillaceae bacterium WGS1546]|uniref:phage tail protein n=1 Tax=Cohnella sp. WGS1546 TaxID=3366810 RepID=UPI00372CFC74